MTSPIAGVWELVSDEEDGLLIFTETHFTDITVKKGRKSWPVPFDPGSVTDEMRAEAWTGLLFAIAGTYEVALLEGDECEITLHPQINRMPLPLRDFAHKAKLQGDTMSGDVGPRHEVWRRIADV